MATRAVRAAPECAPAGHSGAGHGHPHGSAPQVPSDESGGPAEGRGGSAVGAGRTAWRSGNLEIWNPGNLRGCGARQVFRFSGFQVFTLPAPAPAGGVARGAASCSGTDQGGEKLET